MERSPQKPKIFTVKAVMTTWRERRHYFDPVDRRIHTTLDPKDMLQYLRTYIIGRLERRIDATTEKIGELTTSCQKHDMSRYPEADACPCQAKEYWNLDRLDESVHRLKNLDHSVCRWFIWYIWSSTKNPRFPQESIQVWSQTQPVAAWQKFGVAQRNGEVSPSNRRGYIYYVNSREVSSRPAAATNSE